MAWSRKDWRFSSEKRQLQHGLMTAANGALTMRMDEVPDQAEKLGLRAEPCRESVCGAFEQDARRSDHPLAYRSA